MKKDSKKKVGFMYHVNGCLCDVCLAERMKALREEEPLALNCLKLERKLFANILKFCGSVWRGLMSGVKLYCKGRRK